MPTPVATLDEGTVHVENGDQLDGALDLYESWVAIDATTGEEVWLPVWKVTHIEAR